MWDRLLIKCIINFRKQETNIPLTCIFIYAVQTKLVQCIPPSSKLLGGGGGGGVTKEKKCVIYFVHVCTSDILNQNR